MTDTATAAPPEPKTARLADKYAAARSARGWPRSSAAPTSTVCPN